MRSLVRATLAPTVLALSGCANGLPTAPTPVEILTQRYTLVCGDDWNPARPPVLRTFVDITIKGPGEQLTQSDRDVLRKNSADIIHEFAAGGRFVRVAIDIGRVLPLFTPRFFSKGDLISSAATVTDPASFKVVMIVTLDHPVANADLAAAEALGGKIRNVYTSALIGYSVEIEDGMVLRLRALPGVVRANRSGFVCLI